MIRQISTNKENLSKTCGAAPEGDDLNQIIQDLKDTAKEQQVLTEGCLGLAANQINYPFNVIVVWFGGKYMAMVNPEVISHGRDKINKIESCLSRPNIKVRKKRFKKITVRYQNEDGENTEQKFTRVNARVVLHEIDHLLGVCI